MSEGDRDRSFFVFLKKSLLPITFGVLNFAWIIFCIIPQYIDLGTVRIYDYLNMADVSSQYQLNIPLIRYLFEPFLALPFQFSINPLDWLWLIASITAFIFVLVVGADKLTYDGRLLDNPLMKEMRIALNFFIASISLSVLVITIRLFIFYPSHGIDYVISSYVKPVRIATQVCLSIFAIKFIHGLFTLKHGKNDFKSTKIYVKLSQFFYIFSEFGHNLLKNLFRLGTQIYRYTRVLLLIIAVLFTLSGLNLPTYRIQTSLNSDEVLLDLGIQSTESTGFMSVEDRINWYSNQGINGAAFTDYYTNESFEAAEKYIDDNNINFTIIKAQKYNVDGVLLNIYGLNESIKGFNISDAIYYAKSHGGFVIVSNYMNNDSAPYSYNELKTWGIDGFCIIFNGNNLTSEIRQYCLDNGLICIGTSDIIGNQPLNTFIKLTRLDPSNKTVDAIFSDLSLNNHQVCLIEYTSSLDTGVKVIDDFITYIITMDVNQATSWGMWSVLIYILALYAAKKGVKSSIHPR